MVDGCTQATTNDKNTRRNRGKQKETLMAIYKAVMRPALEYASSINMVDFCILDHH